MIMSSEFGIAEYATFFFLITLPCSDSHFSFQKGSVPLTLITAHMAKIYGIDWNHNQENTILTCGQDKQVKFWDITQPKVCQAFLETNAPIWRARFTPFGEGVVTMPQRKENNLMLWSLDNLTTPVHTFVGHQDIPREFVWRCGDPAQYEYQLVSIAKEQELRLWKVDRHHILACKAAKDSAGDLDRGDGLTAGPASITTRENTAKDEEAISKQHSFEITPQGLAHEFSLVNRQIHNIVVEQMNAALRSCIVSAVSAKYDAVVRLRINFPSLYPNGAPPSFDFLPTSTVSVEVKKLLIESLTEVALAHVRYNRSCLEPCLRHLVTNLDNFLSEAMGSGSDSDDQEAPLNKDDNIPFPRTCGACFAGNGKLVCFWSSSSQTYFREGVPKTLEELRRFVSLKKEIQSDFMVDHNELLSLSSSTIIYKPAGGPGFHGGGGLGGMNGGTDDYSEPMSPLDSPSSSSLVDPSISRLSRKQPISAPSLFNSFISVKDISRHLPISEELARNYILTGPPMSQVCLHNSEVARAAGRIDLVKVWNLVGIMMEEDERSRESGDGGGWSKNPFRRKIAASLIDHFRKVADIQMLAMLSCVFSETDSIGYLIGSKVGLQGPDILRADLDQSSVGAHLISTRTFSEATKSKPADLSLTSTFNSLTLTPSARQPSSHPSNRLPSTSGAKETQVTLLERSKKELFNYYRTAYADILYKWQFMNARVEVLKFVDRIPVQLSTLGFDSVCQWCRRQIQKPLPLCRFCNKFAFSCSICHIAVKGISVFCLTCGHGGHVDHLNSWFKAGNRECPTGCRCRCLEYGYSDTL